MERHRNVTTGIYNEKRLKEKPIPENDENVCAIEEVIIPAGSDNDSFSRESNPLDISTEIDTISRANGDLSGETELIGPNEGSVTVTICSTSVSQEPPTSANINTIINSVLVNSSQSESNDQNGDSFVEMQHEIGNQGSSDIFNDPNDIKPNIVPMYAIYTSNNVDILQQLEDWVVDIVDDDMEIMVSSKGFGKPLGVTVDGLVKPEISEEFSGMIPYLDTVIKLLFYK